jgi:hypothetical protein
MSIPIIFIDPNKSSELFLRHNLYFPTYIQQKYIGAVLPIGSELLKERLISAPAHPNRKRRRRRREGSAYMCDL